MPFFFPVQGPPKRFLFFAHHKKHLRHKNHKNIPDVKGSVLGLYGWLETPWVSRTETGERTQLAFNPRTSYYSCAVTGQERTTQEKKLVKSIWKK